MPDQSQTTAQQALDWLRGELTALCEATEESASLNDLATRDTEGKMGAFARGRIHEAKGIRRAMCEMVREKMKELP